MAVWARSWFPHCFVYKWFSFCPGNFPAFYISSSHVWLLLFICIKRFSRISAFFVSVLYQQDIRGCFATDKHMVYRELKFTVCANNCPCHLLRPCVQHTSSRHAVNWCTEVSPPLYAWLLFMILLSVHSGTMCCAVMESEVHCESVRLPLLRQVSLMPFYYDWPAKFIVFRKLCTFISICLTWQEAWWCFTHKWFISCRYVKGYI